MYFRRQGHLALPFYFALKNLVLWGGIFILKKLDIK